MRDSSRSASLRTASGRLASCRRCAQQGRLCLFRVLLAQLLLDGAELLAQEILPLLAAHFTLGLAIDLVAQFEHLQLRAVRCVCSSRMASRRVGASSSACSLGRSRLSREPIMYTSRSGSSLAASICINSADALGCANSMARLRQFDNGALQRLNLGVVCLQARARSRTRAMRYGSVCSIG